MSTSRPRLDRYWLVLAAVILLAAALRLVGLDWDQGTHQHPDERHISDVLTSRIVAPPQRPGDLLDPGRSELNPRSFEPGTTRPRQFAYGSLPLILTDLVACGMDTVSGNACHSPQPRDGARAPYWTAFDRQYLVGRFLTVLADLALILVCFALARRAFGALAGLVTAFFLAVSVLHIQSAHFFVTDTWSALFALGALWALYRAADLGPFATWRSWALAGLLAGASVASKPNTMILAVPALVALWYSLRGELSDRLLLTARRGLVLGASTLLAFAVLEPYALPNLATYWRDFNEQAVIIGGSGDVPYTRQFVGTLPVWHYVWNLLGYGLGPALMALGVLGLGASLARAWRQRSGIDLLLLSWLLAYGVVINTVFAKFLRYTIPLTPVLAILAGAVVAHWLTRAWPATRVHLPPWLARLGRPSLPARSRPLVAAALAALLLLGGLGQALAFVSIYRQPHTRVAASEWIYANVPRGAHIAGETWDDALPLGLPSGQSASAYRYTFVEANHYHDREPAAGVADIARILRESDYIILASQRIHGSTRRLPWRYPVVNRYYDLLMAERLGFEEVYRNDLQPRFGPIHLDSRWADESFSVYDHPPVRVFKKVIDLSDAHVAALFAQAAERDPVPARAAPRDKSLLLNEPLWTWPDLSREAWAGPAGDSWAALALWLVVLAGLVLVGLPWALLLLRPLADGGAGLALPLALLGVGYVAWLGASLRWSTFSAGALLGAALVLGLIGWLLIGRRPDLLAGLWSRRWAVLTTALVFAGGFLLGLSLRLANPDLWQPWLGGEKPMETAFLNGVLRSAYFPPYDPWFSGGYINYYYYGYVLVGVPIKLAGVATAIGFNLAVATLLGMVAAAVCSLGQTLGLALAGRQRPPRPLTVSAVGLIASVLMVGIGNLDGAVQVIQRWTGAIAQYDFWRSSRAIQFVITEFPYFSFLFADLHAHLIAMPVALLVLAAALSWVLAEKAPADAPLWRQAPWPTLGLASFGLGGLAATNAWDVPGYAAAIAGAGFIAAPFAYQAVIRRALWGGAAGVLAVGGAYLLYLPFFANFQSFYGQIGQTRIPSRLAEFLTVWGYLLALVLLVGGVLIVALLRAGGLRRLTPPVIGLVLLAGLATGAVIPRGLPGVAIVAPLIGLLALIWLLNGLSAAGQFSLLMLLGGLGVIVGVEFVYIVDFLQGGEWYRMNTVFKLYLQAWTFLAVGLAGGAALVAREWRGLPALLQGVIATVAVGGLVASLAYPVLVTPDRLRQRFDQTPGPTLDGLAFMEVGMLRDASGADVRFDEDLAAVRWMQANLRGAPVVVEAMIGPYRGNGSRIANATGFPTVLGWDNHEAQQRYPDSIPPRSADVRAFYTSQRAEEVLRLIEEYDVEYIMVGQVERHTTLGRGHLGAQREREPYASPEGLATLRGLADGGVLTEAFSQGETVLYRVNRPLVFPGDRALVASATGATHG